MNAYWVQTKTIQYRQPVYNCYGEYMGDDFPEQWSMACVVYADSPSKARYLFWAQIIEPELGDGFEDALDIFKSIRLIMKGVSHVAGTETMYSEHAPWDDAWHNDYHLIPDPVWREVALRFWDFPKVTDFEDE